MKTKVAQFYFNGSFIYFSGVVWIGWRDLYGIKIYRKNLLTFNITALNYYTLQTELLLKVDCSKLEAKILKQKLMFENRKRIRSHDHLKICRISILLFES